MNGTRLSSGAKKDAKKMPGIIYRVAVDFAATSDLFAPMKSKVSPRTQALSDQDSLGVIDAKTGPYPAARSWSEKDARHCIQSRC
jgi:hypothetical protein